MYSNNYYQVLIMNNGNIIHNIFATSHKDLIDKYLDVYDIQNKTFIKATFTPNDGCRLDDINNYKLIIDEVYIPDWFKDEFVLNVTEKLKSIIKSMIVKGRKRLLLHEGAILVGNAVIAESKHSIIFGMYDKSRIKILDRYSEVCVMTDDSIIDKTNDSSKIVEMKGFSRILKMFDYSKVLKMSEQTSIGIMYDNSRIAMLKGGANVVEMRDDAHADRLKHMSRVDEMHNHSIIEEMWDTTVVRKMFDNSRINYMDEESKVLEMFGDSMIEQMNGNSVVERLCENSLVRKLGVAAKILRNELN